MVEQQPPVEAILAEVLTPHLFRRYFRLCGQDSAAHIFNDFRGWLDGCLMPHLDYQIARPAIRTLADWCLPALCVEGILHPFPDWLKILCIACWDDFYTAHEIEKHLRMAVTIANDPRRREAYGLEEP